MKILLGLFLLTPMILAIGYIGLVIVSPSTILAIVALLLWYVITVKGLMLIFEGMTGQ